MTSFSKQQKIEYLEAKGYTIRHVEHLQYVNWGNFYESSKVQGPGAWDEYIVTHALKGNETPDITLNELSIVFEKEWSDGSKGK